MRFKWMFLLLSVLPVAVRAQYSGAEIYSNSSWKYGKVEIRMRVAKGSGILSTFFTYKNGSEQSGTFWEEIDIEVFGKDNAETFQSNIITGLDPRQLTEEEHHPGYSMGDAYHTYTLEWTPNYVAWYVDDVLFRKTEGGQVNDLTNAQSFRMNIWAAAWEDWVGPFDTQALPAYQFVNWIRYSAYTPGAGDNGTDFTIDWVDDFDMFDAGRWGKANWTFDGNLVEFAPENVVVKDGYLVLALTEADKTGYTGTVPEDILTNNTSHSQVEDMLIYPNPTTGQVYLPSTTDWLLMNSQGEIQKEGGEDHIDLTSLPEGIYVILIEGRSFKIIKQ